MTKRVPTHARHFQALAGRMDYPLQDVLRPERRALPRSEDQSLGGWILRRGFSSLQQLHEWQTQRDLTHAAVRLGGTELSVVNRFPHLQTAFVQIHGSPTKCKQLSSPQTRENRYQDD